MEVILKKSKITASIFKQISSADIESFKEFVVLGYCIVKGVKWIVFYNEETNELRKYLMFKSVVSNTDHSSRPTWITVNFPSNFIDKRYETKSEKESEELIELFNTIKEESLLKGQFFI